MKPLAISLRSLCRVAIATVISVFALSGVAAAQSMTLAWNANGEADLAGYRVEYGTVAGSPTTTVDVGNVTQRQFAGLQAGITYYFRVKAYNASSMESAPSTEVSHTPPLPVVPTLTSISPTSGPSSGGTVITLTGTNFASGGTVRVNGVAATSVTFVSATQVRATTPAGSAGARTVQITNPDGQSASLTNAFTYVGGPGLTSVSPTSGPTTGGTTITITGTGFVSGATVRVNGVSATGVTFVSATQLRANTPAASAGTYAIQVTNPDAQAGTLASRLHLPGRTGHHVDLADVGPDRRRHHDHPHRHQLRLGCDRARQRRRGHWRDLRVGDAAAGEHAGGQRRRATPSRPPTRMARPARWRTPSPTRRRPRRRRRSPRSRRRPARPPAARR